MLLRILNKKLYVFGFLLALQGGLSLALAQSPTLENWLQKRSGFNTLCFYPTTLRMINLNKDPAFYNLVKDIKKLKIVFFSKDKYQTTQEDLRFIKTGIRSEDFKDMIQLKQKGSNISVFVKERNSQPVSFVGLVDSGDQFILIEMLGKIPPSAISDIIAGNMKSTAFGKLTELATFKNDNKKNNQHEKK